MQPKSFSATAFHVAELCLSRYEIEHIKRIKGESGVAANLGSSVHGALELYVKAVYLEKTEQPDFKFLSDMFKISYMTVFSTGDTDTEEYNAGLEMLFKWHNRTDFTAFTVQSCEIKDHFDFPTSIGPIPFNYIWDRFDQLNERTYRVVDYKSNKWAIKPEDLKKKVQARAYALAAAIQLKAQKKEYDKIWVEFDMLRHDGPVGIVFNRADNLATWNFFKNKAEEIIATPDDEAPETLNDECLFCPKKISCTAIGKNISIGGIHTVGSAKKAVDLRAALDWQRKAVTATIKELDNMILTDARGRDEHLFESADNRIIIGVSRTRAISAEMAEKVIGEDLFNKYGGKALGIGQVDKLLKSKELTDDKKKELRGLIFYTTGNPSVKVEAKGAVDGD